VNRFRSELGEQGLSIYEIAPWEKHYAQRDMAWLKLEKRLPKPGEPDTPKVAEFFTWLSSRSPRVAELARLAYYCDLLTDLYVEGTARSGYQDPEDDYDILTLCFELIVDRELDKQRPDSSVKPERAFYSPPAEFEPLGMIEQARLLFKLGPAEWLRDL